MGHWREIVLAFRSSLITAYDFTCSDLAKCSHHDTILALYEGIGALIELSCAFGREMNQLVHIVDTL
jgi:hypothetical protein